MNPTHYNLFLKHVLKKLFLKPVFETRIETYLNIFQLWIAGPKRCFEERCPIPFSSTEYFVEGTYDVSNDLCFPNTSTDLGCGSGSCQTKRKGLCSLAPSKAQRTPLPPGGNCLAVETGSPGWPYPNYPWTEVGQLGEVKNQEKQTAVSLN